MRISWTRATATAFAILALMAAGCDKKQGGATPDDGEQETTEVPDEPPADVDVVTPDQWVAVDELGRSMPTDARSKRDDRNVLMFYWTWHDSSQLNYPSVVNISKIQREVPAALQDYNHPVWGQELQPCFWGQPLFGYYRTTDEWVLRKHAELLADAGVDAVFFDCTNGDFIWEESTEALMKVWTEAQKEGVNVPRIAFMLAFGPTDGSLSAIRKLYNKIYKDKRYQNLWFHLKGKPVIMAYPDNLDLSNATDKAIKNLFEFRPGQPDYVNGGGDGQWGWLECYPQHEYNHGELMTVGVAQNASDYSHGHCYAFNSPGTYGRSYTKANGHDTSEGAYVKGLNFQEQWDRALKYDNKMVFITGWNEWIAGKQPNWPPNDPYKPFAFPDQYDWEHSRDIEPNAEWGDYGDSYYYQLVQNVRRYKGVSKPARVSAEKTMNIGSFDGWKNVSPDFKHYKGNTTRRNHPQHSKSGIIYTNGTGRNDLVDARVARDKDNLYFYIETAADISARTDKGWMRLFINSDREIGTGWKGYDYCLNYKNPDSDSSGTVSKCAGPEWGWTDAGKFEYAVKGNKMEIKVAKSVLGMSGKVSFEFKWSDNMQEEGNILDFYVNGDVAPGGRFNFLYSE